MQSAGDIRAARKKRHSRIRRNMSGSAQRPRLSVFRSLKHIYAQVIDDSSGRTLVSASTLDPELRDNLSGKAKKEKAELVGALIAKRAKGQGVDEVLFDRGGYRYHGRVKSLADGARAEGLRF